MKSDIEHVLNRSNSGAVGVVLASASIILVLLSVSICPFVCIPIRVDIILLVHAIHRYGQLDRVSNDSPYWVVINGICCDGSGAASLLCFESFLSPPLRGHLLPF